MTSPSAQDVPRERLYWFFLLLLTLLVAASWTVPGVLAWWHDFHATATPLRRDGNPQCFDFAQFPAVARAWETGTIERIYDRTYQEELVRQVLGLTAENKLSHDPALLTFSYPPFYCWLPRLLVGLEYRQAFWVWTALQLAFAGVAVLAWRLELADRPRVFWLVVIGFAVMPPAAMVFVLGHASFLGLAILSVFWLLLERRRDFTAGLCLSLLLYKPQLGAVIGLVLLTKQRWQTVLGVAAGAAGLLAASLAVSTRALAEYPTMLRSLGELASSRLDYYERQHSWLAFVVDLTGRAPARFTALESALWLLPLTIMVMVLLWSWRGPWQPVSTCFAANCAATVLATMFVSPYQFSYDLVLLGVPAVYSGKTLDRRPAWHRWALLLSIILVLAGILGTRGVFEGFALPRLAPLGVAAWFAVEVFAAESFRTPLAA